MNKLWRLGSRLSKMEVSHKVSGMIEFVIHPK